ncbi:NADPH:quinone reductase [Intrasporangium mesophilum]
MYAAPGDPSVLEVVQRDRPEPGPSEVRVRVMVSGVNPTDWKSRRGQYGPGAAGPTVPNHDGAGVVDAIGSGPSRFRVGDRVWVTLAGSGRPLSGTAQEYTVVPVERVFPLPAGADFDLGASIGIPAGTAYRALTSAEDGPTRLRDGALQGRTILVHGGAGAVGNAAIQLARWAGARVVSTVSNTSKGQLATAAGAHLILDRRHDDAAGQIRRFAPEGVDLIVEVAAAANANLDLAVLRRRGTIAVYANDRGNGFQVDLGRAMSLNARYQFVLLYTVGWDRINDGATDINLAIEDGALRIGHAAGLPIHRFPLEETSRAHAAVENGTVGKVLVSVGLPTPAATAAGQATTDS